jgi:hypothetical protein
MEINAYREGIPGTAKEKPGNPISRLTAYTQTTTRESGCLTSAGKDFFLSVCFAGRLDARHAARGWRQHQPTQAIR